MVSSIVVLAAGEPAGGAETSQIVIATAGAAVVTGLLLWLVLGHKSGRVPHLGRAAALSSRVSGLPGWAALPVGIGGVALVVALLGMYWDIALHIDDGRDAGPLANPAHYLILAGLFGVFAAGVLACGLPRGGERPGPASIRLTRDWYAPVGGVLMATCGGFALIGFPLDDMWHRLFGQDVTLWGPTHLMLIGGAGMTLVGQAVLLAEGMSATRRDRATGLQSFMTAWRRIGLMGGFLIGLSTFQAEFDFGVPQYRAVFQPLLIALAAGGALVAARLWIGRGGALAAALFFLAVRGAIALLVGPVLGETTPSLPLYLAEALCVEAAALFLLRRPLAFGLVSGALIGTVGFAAEYAWTQFAMTLPWRGDLLPEGVLLAVAGGMSGGVAGALLACGLRAELPRPAVARLSLGAAGAVLAACIANGLVTETPPGARATIAVGADGRAQVRVEPASLLRDAEWATVTAWQGGGLEVQHLDAQGRTSGPIPLTGEWKAILRIHQGRAVAGAPVRLPEDRAIPAPEVPAPRTAATRPLVRDSQVLQRERKDDVPGGLWAAGMATVLALYLAFLTALAWGVGRVGRASAARRDLPGVQREERALVGPEAAGVATDRADVGARRVVVE